MKAIFSLLFTVFSCIIYSQPKRILCHNLVKKTTDTIEIPLFDPSIEHEFTPSFFGTFNYSASQLPLSASGLPTFPSSNFSKKRRVHPDFALDSYPIRTAVRIFAQRADSLFPICSGSMVSNQHVLTANHCVSQLSNDSLMFDSLKICAAYDWGVQHPDFGCVWVKKVYSFEDWQLSNSDFTLLELSTSVGTKTGWIGLEFHTDNSPLFSPIHYKLSYPSIYVPAFDSTPYNGDTLYYNVGQVDWADSSSFGVSNATGIPGESGSSLFYFNGKGFVTNGVLSTALRFRHCRFTPWQYFSFKEIMKNSWETNSSSTASTDLPVIYPNPGTDFIRIKTSSSHLPYTVEIYSVNSQLILQKEQYYSEQAIPTYSLQKGLYLITIENHSESFTEKWIKSY